VPLGANYFTLQRAYEQPSNWAYRRHSALLWPLIFCLFFVTTHLETPVIFGTQQRLMGMLCQPSPSAPAPPRFACILMNAGVVHRVGPHRLNVKIARALTEQNVPSLRLDLSGRGDSLPNPQGAGQDVSDMREAMSHLEATLDIKRFVVVGICSGAVSAYQLAQTDERVVGVLMFDGFVFPTRKTQWLRRWYRWRVMSWADVGQKILSKLRARWRSSAGTASKNPAPLPGSGSPPRAEFAGVMLKLQKRGVRTSMVYSGSFIELHNYHGQLADAFRGEAFLKDLHDKFMPDVDHTATPLAAQRKLINCICEWVKQGS
jgi:pimeloyl-ACP methyl ester carboxylesterase